MTQRKSSYLVCNLKQGAIRLPVPLPLQKPNVFINRCPAYITNPCQFRNIQLPVFESGMVAEEEKRECCRRLVADGRSVFPWLWRSPCQSAHGFVSWQAPTDLTHPLSEKTSLMKSTDFMKPGNWFESGWQIHNSGSDRISEFLHEKAPAGAGAFVQWVFRLGRRVGERSRRYIP